MASLLLALALSAVAFQGKGGSELSRTTTTEIGLVAVSALVLALCVAVRPKGRTYGIVVLGLFTAVTALTCLSLLWSVAPDLSWLDANRMLAYVFAAAAATAAAWVAPLSADVVLRGVLGFCAVIVTYALLSRVFPSSIGHIEFYARIGQPFDYWNAVGVTAALGIPPALWLGARRAGHAPANALAYPLLALLLIALFLTYSRGALLAGGLGVAIWFAFVPLRIRSLTVFLVPVVAALPTILWALSQDAFTADGVTVAQREAVAFEFGLLLLATVLVLMLAGLAIGYATSRHSLPEQLRNRIGAVAVTAAALVPLALVVALAFSDKGITGTISARFTELTSETAQVSNAPNRLTTAASARGKYWRQAIDVFEDRPWAGTGANSFGNARLRYRTDLLVGRHAHGYAVQTLADLGIIGLGLSLAAAIAWLVAALRGAGAQPKRLVALALRQEPDEGYPWTAERVSLVALALCALVFGLHSLVDWTWFVPGPSIAAIVAGAFVAGRGPRGRPDPGPLQWPSRERQVLAAGVLLCALFTCWAIWQPERSEDKVDESLRLVEKRRPADAVKVADEAYDINPLSPKPLWAKAAALQAQGKPKAALRAFEEDVLAHPGDAQTWFRLADFQLHGLDRPADSIETLRGVFYLDPRSEAAERLFLEAHARRRLTAGEPTAGVGTNKPQTQSQ